MAYKVLYIDDEITQPGRDAQKIQELLHVPGYFACDLQPPPKTFANLPTELPDALLVDLDLSTLPVEDEFISYYGSTLASETRMRHPACPIVLITRPQVIGWKTQLLEQSMDVDLIILKDDVNRDPDRQRAKIVALIDGFNALQAIQEQVWESVLVLMGARDEEAHLMRETGPPIEHGQWNIPQVARWIRTVIMEFPGILYDELTAATRLGISLEAFRQPVVQEMMNPARYNGAFGTYRTRWWRDRLFYVAQELMHSCNLVGTISHDFAKAVKLMHNSNLDPAICVYDHTPIADWVCHILRTPVKQQNSLPYYPDSRPPVMDQARVSFTAIQESNQFDERLIDADSYQIVKELWA